MKHLFEHRCFNCGSKKNLQIDHHMPLSLGYGLKIGDMYNAVLLCKRCNNQKSSLLPTKFYTPSQLKILETVYDISTHKNKYTDNYKNIDIENIIDLYEKSLKDKALLYLDYLDYLWNQKKTSKYRLKKGNFYKVYYTNEQRLQTICGKIKYNFLLGKLDIDSRKVRLRDIKGVILWRCH
ncbi:HNH endonuclease [Fusobacteria bacterium ZRK30]|nr:HNH endonuclease [Fusobacteria bacterium ZRK30]